MRPSSPSHDWVKVTCDKDKASKVLCLFISLSIVFKSLFALGYMPGDLTKGQPWVVPCHQSFAWLYEKPGHQAQGDHHQAQGGHQHHNPPEQPTNVKTATKDCGFSTINLVALYTSVVEPTLMGSTKPLGILQIGKEAKAKKTTPTPTSIRAPPLFS